MDNLARNAMLAKQAGMSYGKWKAMQPVVTKTEKAPLPQGWRECEVCGKPYRKHGGQKYCGIDCRKQAYSDKARTIKRVYNKKYREAQKEKKNETTIPQGG